MDPFVTQDHINNNLDFHIDLKDKIEFEKIDVVIIAVSHDEFLKIPLNVWENQFNGKGVVVDIKSAYSKNFFANSKIKHWRL